MPKPNEAQKATEVDVVVIATEANVVEARQIATGQCVFAAKLSATGEMPATHFMGSGMMNADVVDLLRPICTVYDGEWQDALNLFDPVLKRVVEEEEL